MPDPGPAHAPFLAAAEAVARTRPEVDPDLARELMGEAAVRLHNGLVLDGLDEHDTDLAVAALADDLVARDPGAAVRARADAGAPDAHDPDAVRAAWLDAVRVLQL